MTQKKYFPHLVFLALALLVMGPLLNQGYVLTLDMVFTPNMPVASLVGPSYPFYLVLHILSSFLPAYLLQKIILLSILFFSGFGAYCLSKLFLQKEKEEDVFWAPCAAGVLYVFNPYVYSRFMAGQFAVLLGYAILPFFVIVLRRFLSSPSRAGAIRMAVLSISISILSIHTLGLAIIIGFAFLIQAIYEFRDKITWRKDLIRWGSVFLVLVVMGCSYWVLPTILGTSNINKITNSFGNADLKAFATNSEGLGIVGNVFGLQGFWADTKNLYIVPHDVYSWWWIPTIGIWIIILLGIIGAWKKQRQLAMTMLMLLLFGAILSMGSNGSIFASFNRWLIDTMPLFSGYREPQKFLAIIVLVYIYFFTFGLVKLQGFLKRSTALKRYDDLAIATVLLMPLFWAPLMPWAFHGQLHAAQYPVEWDAINDWLDAECKGDCKVLYLPWHMYMRYDFAGRIIVSPAPLYFGTKIVSSTDPELVGASPYSTSPAQKMIEDKFLPSAGKGDTELGKILKTRHIEYVLLAVENDYHKYDYLNHQKDLKVSLKTPTLILYKVN